MNSETTIELHWSGPYELKDFLGSKTNQHDFGVSGVYLWTEVFEGLETLAYVGKASGQPTLFVRQFQHFLATLGGQSSVPAIFRQSKTDWIMNYSDEKVVNTVLDPEAFRVVLTDFYNYLNCSLLYLAPYPDTTLIARMERNLLRDLQPSRTSRGSKSSVASPLHFRHHSANWKKSLSIAADLTRHCFVDS